MGIDDFSYADLQSLAPSPYNVGKNLANAARTAYCSLYRQYPYYTTGTFADVPGQIAKGLNDTICNDQSPPPDPSPPVTGGQCTGVVYTLSTTVHYEAFFNGISQGMQTQNGSQGVSGAIRELHYAIEGTKVYARFIEAYGTPTYPLGVQQQSLLLEQQPPNPLVYNRFVSVDFSLTRNDGQADNCGNPPPDWKDRTTPPPSLIDDVNINVNITPTLVVNVPVTINNFITNNNSRPTVIIKNPSIKFEFGSNGVTTNYPGGGGGIVDLTPVLNATTQIQRDLVDVSGTVQDIYDTRLRFIDNNVPIAVCTDGEASESQVTVKVLSDGNGNSLSSYQDNLFAQLYLLRTEGQIICFPQSNATVILEGSTVPGAGVLYSDIQQPPSIGYLLEILTYDINRLRTYTLYGNDSEFGFGNIALTSSNNAVIGDFTRVFTTKTFIPALDVKFPHKIRVSLKKGITFRVVDLGYNPP